MHYDNPCREWLFTVLSIHNEPNKLKPKIQQEKEIPGRLGQANILRPSSLSINLRTVIIVTKV